MSEWWDEVSRENLGLPSEDSGSGAHARWIIRDEDLWRSEEEELEATAASLAVLRTK